MNAVNLTVDINYQLPNWAKCIISARIDATSSPRVFDCYRLFIDDDLLTERSWIWDNNIVIHEDIWITASKNSSHILTIKPIIEEPVYSKFFINNLQVIDVPFTSEQINDLTISFTL